MYACIDYYMYYLKNVVCFSCRLECFCFSKSFKHCTYFYCGWIMYERFQFKIRSLEICKISIWLFVMSKDSKVCTGNYLNGIFNSTISKSLQNKILNFLIYSRMVLRSHYCHSSTLMTKIAINYKLFLKKTKLLLKESVSNDP